MNFGRRSLKLKLAFFSTLLVIFVAFSLSTYIRSGERKAILESQASNRELTVKSLRQVAREAIIQDNDTDMVNYINLLKQSPMIAYAMIVDGEGKVRVHTNPLDIGKVLSDPPMQNALSYRAREQALTQQVQNEDETILDLSLPIFTGQSGNYFEGAVRIGFDKRQIDEDISASLIEIDQRIFKGFVISLALGFVGAVVLAGFLTRPIKILQDGAQKIGEGKLDYRITINTRDEIQDLADEFNLMGQKLAELDQMKQDFVSNVTHELRSPMTSIRGYIDLLLKEAAGPLEQLQKDYLTIVKNSAVRLGRFIDNLLDVAKIEAQKLKLTPEPQDMHTLAHEMVVLFKPQADEKKITLINDAPATLAKAFVDGDRMAEVLINLMSNAIKFTPENGQVRLAAREASNYIEVSVQDSGIGIPKDMVGKLFNKFEQVKTTKGLARAQKGTGLGLAIAKGIIEAHGGKIWIDSPGPSGK